MCGRRRSRSTPMVVPDPIQPRIASMQNRVASTEQTRRLPDEKDLIDPDEVSGISYGSSQKKKGPSGAKKVGTAALTIPLNTGQGGGINV